MDEFRHKTEFSGEPLLTDYCESLLDSLAKGIKIRADASHNQDPYTVYLGSDTQKGADSEGLQFSAALRLLLAAVRWANSPVYYDLPSSSPRSQPFKAIADIEFEREPGRGERIYFTVTPGTEQAFLEWRDNVSMFLKQEVDSMKEGWHTETRKGVKWFVHDVTGNEDILPLAMIGIAKRQSYNADKNKPAIRYRNDNQSISICVRQDLIDTFLAPVGLTEKDLHLAKRGKGHR